MDGHSARVRARSSVLTKSMESPRCTHWFVCRPPQVGGKWADNVHVMLQTIIMKYSNMIILWCIKDVLRASHISRHSYDGTQLFWLCNSSMKKVWKWRPP
jgi:hypothetical protein